MTWMLARWAAALRGVTTSALTALLVLAALTACYDPAEQPCTIRCSAADVCPGDDACGEDGFCHAAGDTATCTAPTLTVTLAGGGAGVVTSAPPGIDCGGAGTRCTATFDAGTVVTLTGTPGAASRLAAWGGACSGAGACQVTLNDDAAVGATFNVAAQLAVTFDPSRKGAGRITSEPAGIDCPGAACTALFDANSTVVLTTTVDPGSRFGDWVMCAAAAGPQCTVALGTAPAIAQARLIRTPTVDVAVAGSTAFDVTADVPGLTCGADRCTGTFDQGTQLTLQALNTPTSRWRSWTGGPGCPGFMCSVSVDDADVSLTASYVNLFLVTASQDTSINGTGTIVGMGIPCGNGGCTDMIEQGTSLEFIATPDPGNRFGGWTGCDQTVGTNNEICKVTVNSALTLKATFVKLATINFSVNGTGAGSVTANGQPCSTGCQVDPGDVTFVATPSPGSRFGAFSLAACGAGSTCIRTVSGTFAMSASFVLQRTLTVTAAADVTVTAPSLACVGPDTCTLPVDTSTNITLTASTGLPGQAFVWSTGCAGTSCTVSMTSDRTVTVGLEGGHGIWGRAFRQSTQFEREFALATATAPNGDVIVAGQASSGPGLDLGGGSLPMLVVETAWVARFDGTGAHRWSRTLPATARSNITATCVAADGDVVVAGRFSGTLTADVQTLTDPNFPQFMARLDAQTGAVVWMSELAGTAAATEIVTDIACDGDDVVLLYLALGPTVTVNGTQVVSGAPGQFWGLTRLDATGAHVWSKVLLDAPASGAGAAAAITVGPAGDLYAVGTYSQPSTDFGGGALPLPAPHANGFAVRLAAATGAHVWSTALGTAASQGAPCGTGTAGTLLCEPTIVDVTLDGAGGLALLGNTTAPDGTIVNVGPPGAPLDITVAGTSEAFVVRLAASSGALLGGFGFGDASGPRGEHQAHIAASGGDLVIQGRFTTPTLQLGGTTVLGSNTTGLYDLFLARISTSGVVRWAQALRQLATGITGDVTTALAVRPTGEVCVAGVYGGDPPTYDSVDLPQSGNEPDAFVLVTGR